MNELDLIKESLQNELKNPQNYERLVQQSASSIANSLILKPIIDSLSKQIENLRRKNNLKKNYKKILNSSLINLLKMLDDPNLNEENVVLIQKLIILALSRETKPSDELLAKEYFEVAKSLKGSEIVVLQASLARLNQGNLKEDLDIDDIYKDLAKLSGLRFNELVINNYQSLMDKKLLKTPWNRENTQISNSDSNYVFTELGLSFMRYLALYESIKI